MLLDNHHDVYEETHPTFPRGQAIASWPYYQNRYASDNDPRTQSINWKKEL